MTIRRLGQWLAFALMACWLALVPLAVTALLSAITSRHPGLLVALGAIPPGTPLLPDWAFGLLATVLSLAAQQLAFVPLFFATRQVGREFLHTAATLLIAISLFQALNALAPLPWAQDGLLPQGVATAGPTLTAALRLALVLPFLLLGLPRVGARLQGRSRSSTSGREGERGPGIPRPQIEPQTERRGALWPALAASAAIVWPWVLVGSLGSPGTTAANGLQAMPNGLGEEILFRGFAFAWLWRVTESRRAGAVGSLLLFVAAEGGTVLPTGDLAVLPRFFSALLLGLLVTELTVRAGGGIGPAVIVHLLYSWFPLAFVDPRSQEEILHWLAHTWAPLAAGGVGLLLWLGRKLMRAKRQSPAALPSTPRRRRSARMSAAFAAVTWASVALLYITLGEPGFHPDGFLIFLKDQADLGPAASIADPLERRAWVYRTLVETAERSQASLRAELDRQGLDYRPHYLINVIEVRQRPGLRRAFARDAGVAAVMYQPGVRPYPRTFRIPAIDATGPQGVEWNLREIGTDRVWQLGVTGEGVIVGSADTGVVWDHPALKAAYLGWDARQGTADHNYHWYDPWDARSVPWDDDGHGTHTTGIIVGQDGQNQVGVAPGARWIACRNMRHGIGNPGGYLSCLEFLLAPFPLDGDPFHDGDPAQGAQVVNNSWGCPREEGCLPDTLRQAVENLRAAGQMMVVSAGNDGPTCGTVRDPPALYSAVLSVGALDKGDKATGFSSRGPVTADGSQRLKPDLVAPGVDIRSSVPGGYASLAGTSMAGPHVAGAVALLWSAEPPLAGDVSRTQAILTERAHRLTVDAVCSQGSFPAGITCACGGDGPETVPNEVYGWGRVDVGAALEEVQAEQ